jgi:hypothetical protein
MVNENYAAMKRAFYEGFTSIATTPIQDLTMALQELLHVCNNIELQHP